MTAENPQPVRRGRAIEANVEVMIGPSVGPLVRMHGEVLPSRTPWSASLPDRPEAKMNTGPISRPRDRKISNCDSCGIRPVRSVPGWRVEKIFVGPPPIPPS